MLLLLLNMNRKYLRTYSVSNINRLEYANFAICRALCWLESVKLITCTT